LQQNQQFFRKMKILKQLKLAKSRRQHVKLKETRRFHCDGCARRLRPVGGSLKKGHTIGDDSVLMARQVWKGCQRPVPGRCKLAVAAKQGEHPQYISFLPPDSPYQNKQYFHNHSMDTCLLHATPRAFSKSQMSRTTGVAPIDRYTTNTVTTSPRLTGSYHFYLYLCQLS
jgi:hypothetical protein